MASQTQREFDETKQAAEAMADLLGAEGVEMRIVEYTRVRGEWLINCLVADQQRVFHGPRLVQNVRERNTVGIQPTDNRPE